MSGVLGGLGIGGGVGAGSCGRLKIGVCNGKRGSTRIKRLPRITQASRLYADVGEALNVRGCPRQVTLVELNSEEDMVGGCDVKEGRFTTATRTTLVSSHMIRCASGKKGRLADLLSTYVYRVHNV